MARSASKASQSHGTRVFCAIEAICISPYGINPIGTRKIDEDMKADATVFVHDEVLSLNQQLLDSLSSSSRHGLSRETRRSPCDWISFNIVFVPNPNFGDALRPYIRQGKFFNKNMFRGIVSFADIGDKPDIHFYPYDARAHAVSTTTFAEMVTPYGTLHVLYDTKHDKVVAAGDKIPVPETKYFYPDFGPESAGIPDSLQERRR